MGKSTNGPDMLDCLNYLKEIEVTTGQLICVLLESDGASVGGWWVMHAFTRPPGMEYLGDTAGVGATTRWPQREYREFPSALYGLLATIDGLWARR